MKMKKPIMISIASKFMLLLEFAIIIHAFLVIPKTSNIRSKFHVPVVSETSVIQDKIETNQSVESDVDIERRAAVLRLNQRKLTREMKKLRGGSSSRKALDALGATYPHLTISSNETSMMCDESEWSYSRLLNILYQDTNSPILSDAGLPLVIDGKSISMTIEVLCKASNNISAATLLLKRSVDGVLYNRQLRNDKYHTDDNNELCIVYKALLSMLGRVQPQSSSHCADKRHQNEVYSNCTLHLLQEHIRDVACIQPGLQLYHAALNSLGRQGNYEAVLLLLNNMQSPTKADRMAYQIAISSLAKSGRECYAATQLLNLMKERGFSPDLVCYNEVLIGITKQAGSDKGRRWHELALDILQDIESQKELSNCITDQTYNSVIAACGKEGAWAAAASVARRSNSSAFCNYNTAVDSEQQSSYFCNLEVFEKHGKGKEAWWKVAMYRCGTNIKISVGIQLHRNPKQNGFSLVFYRGDEMKVGRILLAPFTNSHYSSIVGMEVNRELRGEGLSKVLIAIWLHICLYTKKAFPRAAKMNKPLIALVLSKFGFVPDDGGTRCVLIRLENDAKDHNPRFGLYSAQRKSLDGAFSHRVLRTQNIKLLGSPPNSRGVDVVIKTTFSHPYKPPDDGRNDDELQRERTLLEEKINATLNLGENNDKGGGKMEYFASNEKLRRAFLSF